MQCGVNVLVPSCLKPWLKYLPAASVRPNHFVNDVLGIRMTINIEFMIAPIFKQ